MFKHEHKMSLTLMSRCHEQQTSLDILIHALGTAREM